MLGLEHWSHSSKDHRCDVFPPPSSVTSLCFYQELCHALEHHPDTQLIIFKIILTTKHTELDKVCEAYLNIIIREVIGNSFIIVACPVLRSISCTVSCSTLLSRPINQSEVSIRLSQPIRSEQYSVSTNQYWILFWVNQSEKYLPVSQSLPWAAWWSRRCERVRILIRTSAVNILLQCSSCVLAASCRFVTWILHSC